MTSNITLYTSINPRTPNLQKIVESWNGFADYYSFNSNEEIDQLSQFSHFNFIATKLLHNKYASLDTILSKQLEAQTDLVALINSDIYIEYLEEIDPDVCSLGVRTDIDSFDKKYNRKKFKWGIDFFVYPKDWIPFIWSDGLYIGVPWWDYILPLSLKWNGLRTKELSQSKLLHIRHEHVLGPEYWDMRHTQYKKFGIDPTSYIHLYNLLW